MRSHASTPSASASETESWDHVLRDSPVYLRRSLERMTGTARVRVAGVTFDGRQVGGSAASRTAADREWAGVWGRQGTGKDRVYGLLLRAACIWVRCWGHAWWM